MERLTAERCNGIKTGYWSPYKKEDIVQCLGAYEDTGMTPEEIDELVHKSYGPLHKKLGQWIDAEKSGRLVVLPCKLGDTVWFITSPINIAGMETDNEQPMIFECKVRSASFYANAGMQIRLYHQGAFVASYITAGDFGKTVFPTREEAEAALKNEATP